MAWETRRGGRRRYYTRSVRKGSRVQREYLGCGAAGELAATLDAVRRIEREFEARVARAEDEAHARAAGPLEQLCRLSDLLLTTSLTHQGFHKHGGVWRRPRHVPDHADPRE
jgi:cob(I)alamin adenosyltransferase